MQGGWLGTDVDRGANFCEARSGTVRQPVNTASNLGFVVAGLVIAWQAGRTGGLGAGTLSRMPSLATAYACLVVLLGPGSMAMHATESSLGGHLDMASMYVVAAFAVSYAAMRRWSKGRGFLVAVFVAVVVVCELVGLAGELAFLGHAGNLAFGAALATALWLESRIARGGRVALDTRWAWAAAGTILVALAVWSTAKGGSPLCDPASLYQGHAVWHLLCAVSAWCLFRLYVSEKGHSL